VYLLGFTYHHPVPVYIRCNEIVKAAAPAPPGDPENLPEYSFTISGDPENVPALTFTISGYPENLPALTFAISGYPENIPALTFMISNAIGKPKC
jgi:hypothetical protein